MRTQKSKAPRVATSKEVQWYVKTKTSLVSEWNNPKAPRSRCLDPCLLHCLHQTGVALAASHLRYCPACECLPSKEYRFLSTGNPFGAMHTSSTAKILRTMGKPHICLHRSRRSQKQKIFANSNANLQQDYIYRVPFNTMLHMQQYEPLD